ncbi:MAG: hypothetical protein SFW09_23635 [Hyphomicrobiaceae bacterium]|nr:hypothetical protein [Hyphomicrobiaceae bacterium]
MHSHDEKRQADEPGRGHDDRKADRKDRTEKKLDKAIADTFPASDPIAPGDVTADDQPRRPVDRKPPRIDVELVKELARKVRRRLRG